MTTENPPERLPIRSIAILGAGIVGLSAAIAFARALPGLCITLIETPIDPAALADRMPGTLPSITPFHDQIGLTEANLIAAGATHRLGTRLSDWNPDGTSVVLAHGTRGGSMGPGAFHQYWLNARRQGDVAPFDAFSAAATIATAHRFVHPTEDATSPLGSFDYALRLDPPRYAALLRALARHVGITPIAGSFGSVARRADGGVEAILLADGRRIAADLYLDCSGPTAVLRSAIDTRREDWHAALPIDRLLLGTMPGQTVIPADTVTAVPAGWRLASPLRDRTLMTLAYASGLTADASAMRILPTGREVVRLAPGTRREAWVHNVLAIGDAATVLDPLAQANLHMAHAAIIRAIQLLPGRDCAPVELAQYNEQTYRHAVRIRDFQAAHLFASKRTKGAFWNRLRDLRSPDSLAHTIEQFAHRGRLPFYEDESFDADDWHGLLLGLGMIPRVPDPIASATPIDTVSAKLHHLAATIAALSARLPPYPDYLAHLERTR